MRFIAILLLFIFRYSAFSQPLDYEGNKLISYSLWKTSSKEDLRKKLKDNKIPRALVRVKYAVNIYDIKYKTCWHDGTCIMASGLYFVPQEVKKPVPQLVYHHGTSFKPGRNINMAGEEYLSLGMAVDGYAVIFPDYIGLGHGDRFHLYQHAESEGQATADMLLAIRELNDTLGIKTSNQLFLTGYSQGGHAAMAAHRTLQEKYADEFTVTASSPMSGAYDMAGAQASMLFENYSHPYYLVYLLKTYNEVYNIVPNLSSVYNAPYDSLINKMFDGEISSQEMNKLLPKTPKLMIKDSIVNLFINDPNFKLRKAFADNSLINWKPQAPVQLCYCTADEQVKAENSIIAYNNFKALGANNIKLLDAGKKYGHVNCAIFASMYSKFYFDSFRKGSEKGRRGSHGKRMLLSFAKLYIKP
jgi:pimeloyl-ACP methyl ester carboxylesterase